MTPDFQELVIGLSKKKHRFYDQPLVYKHPCGQIEEGDVPSAISLTDQERENSTAEACARRELFRETGITDSHHEDHVKLNYERNFHGKEGPLKQYHFLVVLKEKIELERNIIEADEMHPPEYWLTITALLGGENGKKLNPFHQLALFKCIQEMRDAGLGHDHRFASFRQLEEDIYDAGINLDARAIELAGMIKNGEI